MHSQWWSESRSATIQPNVKKSGVPPSMTHGKIGLMRSPQSSTDTLANVGAIGMIGMITMVTGDPRL